MYVLCRYLDPLGLRGQSIRESHAMSYEDVCFFIIVCILMQGLALVGMYVCRYAYTHAQTETYCVAVALRGVHIAERAYMHIHLHIHRTRSVYL